MCSFDLKFKILNKKGNIESNVTTTKPSLPYTSQIQINLGLTLKAVNRKVEVEKCLFALCFSALLKLLLFVQGKI